LGHPRGEPFDMARAERTETGTIAEPLIEINDELIHLSFIDLPGDELIGVRAQGSGDRARGNGGAFIAEPAAIATEPAVAAAPAIPAQAARQNGRQHQTWANPSPPIAGEPPGLTDLLHEWASVLHLSRLSL